MAILKIALNHCCTKRLTLTSLALFGLLLTSCNKSATEPVVPPANPNAEIVILSPLGGESFKVGSALSIKWKLQGKGIDEISSVNILLSTDDGKTWMGLVHQSIAPQDSNWGNFTWTVPASFTYVGVEYPLVGNSTLKIMVKDYQLSESNKTAITQRPFSIVAK